MSKLRYKEGGVWKSIAPSQKEFDDNKAEVTAQLAEKAKQTDLNTTNNNVALKASIGYVDNKFSLIGNANPKGVYTTLAALQTAFPTGNTNVYIVSADGKWYYWSGTAWTAGGVYQSTGIAPKSITALQTTFFNKGKNKFDSTWEAGRIDATGVNASSSEFARTGFVDALPSTRYVATFTGLTGVNYYAHYYGDNNAFISSSASLGTTGIAVFTTPANTKTVRFTTYKVAAANVGLIPTNTQLELGIIPTPYVSNESNELNSNYIGDKTIDPKKTTFFKPKKNLFNSIWATGGIQADGALFSGQEAGRTNFVEVSANVQYTVSFTGLVGASYYVSYFDTNKNFISRTASFQTLTYTFLTPANAVYVAFSTFKTGSVNPFPTTTQLELGSTATEYEPYSLIFDMLDGSVSPSKTTFFVPKKNMFNGSWSKGVLMADGTTWDTQEGAKTNKVEVKPNAEYTASFSGLTGATYYVVFYDENGILIGRTAGNQTLNVTFLTLSNCKFVAFSTYKAASVLPIPTTTQLELGSAATEYEPYGIKFKEEYLGDLGSIATNINPYIIGVAHRGYSNTAPENTEPAYVLAKQKGFEYVECDIQFTSDNQPVLFHDTTIERTSTGTGAISDHTLANLKLLDAGSWKGVQYTGTRILSFYEFLLLCKKLGVKPYVDIKPTLAIVSTARAQMLVDTAKKLGMLKDVTWMADFEWLDRIRQFDPKARIAFVASTPSTAIVDGLAARLVDGENAFLNVDYTQITQALSDQCAVAGIGLEAWIVNTESDIVALSQYNIQGITTDFLNVGEVLLDSVTP